MNKIEAAFDKYGQAHPTIGAVICAAVWAVALFLTLGLLNSFRSIVILAVLVLASAGGVGFYMRRHWVKL